MTTPIQSNPFQSALNLNTGNQSFQEMNRSERKQVVQDHLQMRLGDLSFGQLKTYLDRANNSLNALPSDQVDFVFKNAKSMLNQDLASGQDILPLHTYVIRSVIKFGGDMGEQLVPKFLGVLRHDLKAKAKQEVVGVSNVSNPTLTKTTPITQANNAQPGGRLNQLG